MWQMWAVACWLAALQFTEAGDQVVMFQNRAVEDRGNFTNCGAKETNFVLNWAPRILKTGETLDVEFGFAAVQTFVHGTLCVDVWLDGVPDPIYSDCNDQTCDDFAKFIKQFYPGFSCPIQKGAEFHIKGFKFEITPNIPLPSGKFHVHATGKNQDAAEIFCIDGHIEAVDE